jgi:hypothetical protein
MESIPSIDFSEYSEDDDEDNALPPFPTFSAVANVKEVSTSTSPLSVQLSCTSNFSLPIASTHKLLYDFHGRQEDELTVTMGDEVTLISVEMEGWSKCKSKSGSVGMLPNNYLVEISNPPELPPRKTVKTLKKTLARALYDYTPQNVDEMAFKAGDLLEQMEENGRDENLWKMMVNKRTGQHGLVPGNYIISVNSGGEHQQQTLHQQKQRAPYYMGEIKGNETCEKEKVEIPSAPPLDAEDTTVKKERCKMNVTEAAAAATTTLTTTMTTSTTATNMAVPVMVHSNEHIDISIPIKGTYLSHEDELKHVLEISRSDTYSSNTNATITSNKTNMRLKKRVQLPLAGELIYNCDGHIQGEMYERVRRCTKEDDHLIMTKGNGEQKVEMDQMFSKATSINTTTKSSDGVRGSRIKQWFSRMKPVRESVRGISSSPKKWRYGRSWRSRLVTIDTEKYKMTFYYPMKESNGQITVRKGKFD